MDQNDGRDEMGDVPDDLGGTSVCGDTLCSFSDIFDHTKDVCDQLDDLMIDVILMYVIIKTIDER